MAWDEDLFFESAMRLTLEAAQVMRSSIVADKTVKEKQGDWDLVTEYDRAIEDIIVGKLRQQFPTHKFIGEESTGNDIPELTDDPTWIIDPIDGTMNFIHGFPHTCIVIGLSISKEMRIGIVYNPILEQLFTARKGRGAFLNGKPIRTSSVDDISKAMVCLETGFLKVKSLRNKMLERIKIVSTKTQGLRTLGSAAITLCYIALGVVEGYQIEGPGICTWDIAAPSLIISEAGGVVVDRVTGKRVDLMHPRAIGACNEKIAVELMRIIKEADGRAEAEGN
ncbi:inositol monophosphatase 2 [Diachasma alloeum]|uniref:inositol monophosphatase 2 n=1 Tax=Diachasma alloeum TaxID=454923 RepID=UPI0007381D00|nr:inositol monophosphatase 2 [Diachasma alloeum]